MVDYRLDSAAKFDNNSLKTVIPNWSEYVLPEGKTYNPADVKKVVPPPVERPVAPPVERPVAKPASPPPKDPTAREYSEWYQRVSAQADKNGKGHLTISDIYDAMGKLRGKDEAMAAVVTAHAKQFMPNVLDFKEEDVRSLAERNGPDVLNDFKKEEEIAMKATKVVDWIKDRRADLNPDEKGLVSSGRLDKALHSPKFADPESQRMLQFLEAEYSNLSIIIPKSRGSSLSFNIGIPTKDSDLANLLPSTTNDGGMESLYAQKFIAGGGLVGFGVGLIATQKLGYGALAVGAGTIGGSMVGMGIGLTVAAINYRVFKQQLFPTFLEHLDAAVAAN